ncbi:hypothetical protein HHI36_010258 [Cryptolaemus montrouzieri]|uniref:AMP-dependent synthetase/ligase domain-containing protein n=1 Tax=Cryptolaemus montrouzieri TaxID=559131 RepID=A0ABD2MI53_9CUCU
MSRIIINTLGISKYVHNGRIVSTFHPNFETAGRKYSVNQRRYVPTFRGRFYSSATAESQLFREFIVDSPLSRKDIPNQNLVEFLYDDLNEKNMEQSAATCGATGRTYNYGMLRMLINRFAQAVISHCRMRPREVVGLLLPNIPEFIIASHGAMEAGLPVTFVNPLYTANEIQRQFKNAEVKLIVTVPQLLDVALEVSAELIDYRGTISIGGEDDLGRQVFGLESLLTAGYEAELPGISPRELAILPYSSGTTGVPKGVMLSHYNLVANLNQVDHPDLRVLMTQMIL